MSPWQTQRGKRGFTLVELMIVVALIAIIVTLAAPSFRDMIVTQRLRGVNAQLVTDLAFARSEAISRGSYIQFRLQSNSAQSCYIIYARRDNPLSPSTCDCTASPGARCTIISGLIEVRTVSIPKSDAITVFGQPAVFNFDPRTGGIVLPPTDDEVQPPNQAVVETYISADTQRKFRNQVGPSGRVSVCTPSGSPLGGITC